ncbi:MAG TPA: LysM peptidoglycan-binding domain-containing protein [Candidatus Methanoperedens sp.]
MEKAYLERKDNGDLIPFVFNPKEFSVEKSNQFAEVNIPGLSSPILQFVRGNARTITMDLFFDTYEEGIDVRVYTDRITGWEAGEEKGLMDIDSDLHAPPVCAFRWGDFRFQCIIERVSKRFTMFLPNGKPVRATLNVTLKEYTDAEEQIRRISAQSADITKRWTVIHGDSLWSIAAREYGDPKDWRLIAEENGIDNPRLLKPGQVLIIPRKEQTWH